MSGLKLKQSLLRFWTLMSLSASLSAVAARVEDPPLTPSTGGRMIKLSALQVGDILLSTTSARVSKVIREATGDGPVSHARIYAGDGFVIEAVSEGVRLVKLEEAMKEDTITVAFRHPRGQRDKAANRAVEYARSQLGKPYDYWGVVRDGFFRLLSSGGKIKVSLGTRNNAFYCSRLVIQSYAEVGLPLTTNNPAWQSPNDLAALSWVDDLHYIGHLKYQREK
jgi:uncharacterized protein YycO